MLSLTELGYARERLKVMKTRHAFEERARRLGRACAVLEEALEQVSVTMISMCG